MKRIRWLLAAVLLALLLVIPAGADAVTDTISIYVGYYGWSEDEYVEKATYHWSELDDLYGGALDTHTEIYSYLSGGARTYLVAARGFYIRDLLYYAGIDTGSVASIDFFTKDHDNGAYRSFSAYSLLEMPRYYFPNLAANEETGEIYAYDGDNIWNGATTVESMLALEDYTEWDVPGVEFEQLYDPNMMSAGARFHLFFGQSDPTEASTSSAAKYCYKLLITFSGTPVLTTEESNLDMKIGSGHQILVDVDAEDGLLNDYVRNHITWASSDETVAAVAQDGTITVLAPGDAWITASFGESSVGVSVHVEPEPEPEPEPSPSPSVEPEPIVEPSPSPSPSPSLPPTPSPSPSPIPATGTGGTGTSPSAQPSAGTARSVTSPGGTNLPESQWPDELLEEGVEEAAILPDISEEPVLEARISPPAAVPVDTVSGPRVYAISAAALAGMRKGNADVADNAGGVMDSDTEQLVLTAPDRANPILMTVLAGIAAFLLGGAFELIRFRRLLRGKRT